MSEKPKLERQNNNFRNRNDSVETFDVDAVEKEMFTDKKKVGDVSIEGQALKYQERDTATPISGE